MGNDDKFLDPVDLTRLVISTYPIYWHWYVIVGILMGVLYGFIGTFCVHFGVFTERMVLSALALVAWTFALVFQGQDRLMAHGLVHVGDPPVTCFLGISRLHIRFEDICSTSEVFAVLLILAEISIGREVDIALHFWVSVLVCADTFLLLSWMQLRGLRKILKFIISHPPGFLEKAV